MVITSAPGKILWIGGYSVLEKGNISFVTGVDKRVYSKAVMSNKIIINMPQFNVNLSGTFDENRIVFDRELDDNEKKYSSFVRVAVETCLRYFKHKGISVSGVEIETFSDPAFGFGETKTGLGSSAAVTTAVTAVLFELHDLPIEKNRDLIHKMAQYVHFRVQGKVGSGFDIAASCFGGHAYSRYSPELIKDIPENAPIETIAEAIEKEWDYTAEHLPLPDKFIVVMGNFVGESASTSAMVKKINEWKAKNPEEYKKLMNELNNANSDAIKWLKELNRSINNKNLDNFKQAVEKGRILTKKLGEFSSAPIEPDELTAVIDETMKHGAFVAKLPGAGGGDNISAICLSEYDKKKVAEFWRNYKEKTIEPVDISISNIGVRLEPESEFKRIEKQFL